MITNTAVKVGDSVTTLGVRGTVKRVSKSGEWADVAWEMGSKEWTKRTATSILTVLHTTRNKKWWRNPKRSYEEYEKRQAENENFMFHAHLVEGNSALGFSEKDST